MASTFLFTAPPCCRFVNYADSSAAERARQAMNGMRAGDKILHVMVQTNHSSSSGLVNGSRTQSGGMDAAAAAAMLAAAAGQQVLPAQHDWPLLPPANPAMMW